LRGESDETTYSDAKRKVRRLLEQQRQVLESPAATGNKLKRSIMMAPGLTIFCTLSCAGRNVPLHALSAKQGAPIEAIVIDEACQVQILSSLDELY
jgi:hypothetical protein